MLVLGLRSGTVSYSFSSGFREGHWCARFLFLLGQFSYLLKLLIIGLSIEDRMIKVYKLKRQDNIVTWYFKYLRNMLCSQDCCYVVVAEDKKCVFSWVRCIHIMRQTMFLFESVLKEPKLCINECQRVVRLRISGDFRLNVTIFIQSYVCHTNRESTYDLTS